MSGTLSRGSPEHTHCIICYQCEQRSSAAGAEGLAAINEGVTAGSHLAMPARTVNKSSKA